MMADPVVVWWIDMLQHGVCRRNDQVRSLSGAANAKPTSARSLPRQSSHFSLLSIPPTAIMAPRSYSKTYKVPRRRKYHIQHQGVASLMIITAFEAARLYVIPTT